MLVVVVKDNKVEESGELRQLFKNVSFAGGVPNQDWLNDNNVLFLETLAHDISTQKSEPADPYIKDGKAYLNTVTDLTTEEKTALDKEISDGIAESQRKKRDSRLAETDWMVTKALEAGTTIADNWKTYRQALRDLPTHKNWPNLKSPDPIEGGDNDWPTKPS
tara:strand:+ start:2702 stop:3190 length:489 start_codon:yes stop_codon:yes gene_type:complete